MTKKTKPEEEVLRKFEKSNRDFFKSIRKKWKDDFFTDIVNSIWHENPEVGVNASFIFFEEIANICSVTISLAINSYNIPIKQKEFYREKFRAHLIKLVNKSFDDVINNEEDRYKEVENISVEEMTKVKKIFGIKDATNDKKIN